ncbi:MAG: hypothetical protein JWM93_3070 [Frankiales bacterium]|nr:hypothetical protein [Frankiales bacterium]
MRFRRLAALSTAAGLIAVATPATLPVDVAWGAPTDLTMFFTVDTNGDDSHGIARSHADATGAVVIAERADTHYDEIDASPVGEAIVYTKYVGTTIGLYADNRQLSSPRLLFAAHLEGTRFHIPYHPSFSPDGGTVLFTVFEYDDADTVVETHLETVPVTGGASTVVARSTGLFDGSFHPTDGTRIAASRWAGDGAAVIGVLTGPSLTFSAVPGTTSTDFVRFSPDGAQLVFTSGDGALYVASTDGTVLHTVIGDATYPVWLDSTSVLFTMTPAGASGADVFRLDLAASAPTQLTNTAADERALATPRANDPAPGAPARIAAVLNGARPVVSWTRPIDGDLRDIVVRRALGTSAPASVTDGEAVTGVGQSSVTDTVTVGETYSYAVFAVDAASQASPAATVTLQALAKPAIVVPANAWTSSSGARIPVSWGAGDPVGTHYRVSWGAGSTPKTWRTWYADTTATAATFGSGVQTTGGSYAIRVAAIDAYGHATAGTVDTVLVPRDDTEATFSRGWTRLSATSYWNKSQHATRVAGAASSLRFTGSKLQVIGARCSVCGSFKVYVDGRYRGTFSSRSAATHNRAVLYTYSAATVQTHTIRIVNVASRQHPQLRLDAFAVTR